MIEGDSIVYDILYPHPIWTVWRALTTAEALAAWLMPNDFVAEVGHRFTFRTTPEQGWSGIVSCQVVALDAPHRIAYTWQGGPQFPKTLVTFTLETVEQQTRLHLEHSGFAAGGPMGLSVRDLLDSGWGSNILRRALPELLDRWAREAQAPGQD
jgi:uncharacterized protein YndB with AHSA1/START domain